MYQRKVDVDMLNAVKSVLADVSSVSPSSEQRTYPHEPCTFYRYADTEQNQFSQGLVFHRMKKVHTQNWLFRVSNR